MMKEMISNAASVVSNATSTAAVPMGGLVTFWNWLNGHNISWWVGLLTIIVLILQIRDHLFRHKEDAR